MNKFNEELDDLKKANQEIKLDDEFKASLKMKLDEEISKQEEKLNRKPKLNLLPRKLIPVTVCLFVLLVTMQTFADEIESLVKCVFSNVDETVEEAIANGNYQKIDMEYVEHDGISIKVDYIIQENNNTYIAFNVLSDEEYDNIYCSEIILQDMNENTKNFYDIYVNIIREATSKKSEKMIFKLNDYNFKIKKIIVKKVTIEIDGKQEHKENTWIIDLL